MSKALENVIKLRSIFDVKAFGAKGDGSTDDTAAIQAAATAAQNATLFFPPGTYVCANVQLPGNITLTGDAAIKLKPLPSLDFSPIFALTASDVRVDGLTFDGNRSNQPSDGFSDSWAGGPNGTGKSNRAAFFATATGTRLVIENCEFVQFYAGSIALRNWSQVTVRNCLFQSCNFEGVVFNLGNTTQTRELKVLGCVFKNIASGDATVNANCIVATNAAGIDIENTNADNFERTFVKLENCTDCNVSGNKVGNNTKAGFSVIQAQASGQRITIAGNILAGVQKGIQISSGAFSDVHIAGNTITSVASSSGSPDGILIEEATNAIVANNILNSVQRHGIYLLDCVNAAITGNVVASTAAVNGNAILVSLSAGVNGRTYVLANNVLNGKQDTNTGIVSIDGPGTYQALTIANNALRGRSATNSRGIWSSSSAVFTNAIVSHNVLASDCAIEMYPAAGSVLQAIGNMASRVVSPAGAYARIVGVGSSAPSTGDYYVGDIFLHSAPAAGGHIGWVCTADGNPGTWKTYAAIAA
jgi:parallel beta-helix repeat protein